jgi:hypothetical protein
MADAGSADCEQFAHKLAHDYFCRFHMSVILAAVIASGVLASKGLMEMGVPLGYRYPLAVATSYLVFLLLIRVWIWYVSVRSASRFRGPDLGSFSFGGGSGGGGGSFGGSIGGRSGSGFSGFGGGSSGGGGASSDWQANEAAAVVSQPSSGASHSSSWLSGIDFGGGDNDGWMVIVLLIALVMGILGGGVYLVVAAPHILPEAAAQLLLAGGLTRVSKEHHHNWMGGVLWSTWIPFLIVMLVAGALGWEAHRYCPVAPRLIDLLHCPGR